MRFVFNKYVGAMSVHKYCIILFPNGTTRGGDLLISNVGYHYTRKVDNRRNRKQRRVNRERKAHRPIDPKTLDFDLDI